MMLINWDKQYRTAFKLVGNLNKDLVHYCYLHIVDTVDTTAIKYPDTYFYRVMISKITQFKKLYDPFTEQISDIEDEPIEQINIPDISKQLEILSKQGYYEEVYIFKCLAQGDKITDIAKKTHVHHAELKKMFNFVKDIILERYDGNNLDVIY